MAAARELWDHPRVGWLVKAAVLYVVLGCGLAGALLQETVGMESAGLARPRCSRYTWLPVLVGLMLVTGLANIDVTPELATRVAMAFGAGRTTHLKFGTSVMVLPGRNPIVLAKELATIDHISNGRFVLGMGAGWFEPESGNWYVDSAFPRFE